MSDYSGSRVDLEVARYGLRTFRAVRASEVNYDMWIPSTTALMQMFLGGGFDPLEDNPSDPLTLCSVAQAGAHWSDGVCKAECLDSSLSVMRVWAQVIFSEDCYGNRHEAPGADCSCGIYATLSLEHLNRQYGDEAKNIVAVIAAEGQTIIGTRGFRTQYARVVAYWCDDKLAAPAQRQFRDARRYGYMPSMLRDYQLHHSDPVKKLAL